MPRLEPSPENKSDKCRGRIERCGCVCSFPSGSDSKRRAPCVRWSSLEGTLLGFTVFLHRGTKDWDSRPVRLASSFVWRRVARKEA